MLPLTLVSLTACDSSQTLSQEQEIRPVTDHKPIVLTTFTVIADMAREIGQDDIDVRSITRPDAEIHDYQPVQEDIKRAQQADLILQNGLGLERWFDKFMARVKAPSVTLSDGVTPLNITAGQYEGKPNPHAWMSINNAHIYIDNIAHAYSKLLPEKADLFAQRASDYKERITHIGEKMKKQLDAIPQHQRALITCEGAFSYLARDMQLEERYLWPVNAENAMTPRSRAELEQYISDNNIPAVFCESTVEDKMKPVVENTSAVYGGTLYVDSLSVKNGPVPTYEKLLEYDTQVIAHALTR